MFKKNLKLYKSLVIFFNIVIATIAGFLIVLAGNINPTSAPGDTMYNLEQIYCKLNGDGCNPVANYDLDSPGSPAGTMHTLDDLYGAVPDFAHPGIAASATAADVFRGKTFYYNSSTPTTGTLDLVCGSNITTFDGTGNKVTPDYSGGNNRWCMGVSATTDGGTATASDIRCGKTAWVNGVELIGSSSQSCLGGTTCLRCLGGACVSSTADVKYLSSPSPATTCMAKCNSLSESCTSTGTDLNGTNGLCAYQSCWWNGFFTQCGTGTSACNCNTTIQACPQYVSCYYATYCRCCSR